MDMAGDRRSWVGGQDSRREEHKTGSMSIVFVFVFCRSREEKNKKKLGK
jgi:hypothetical protein